MESSLPSTAGFEVRVLPIDRLVPAPYNPRRVLKPTDRAYRKLEASLRTFGLVEPLVWNERTGHVVGVAEVPVSVVNLTDTREKALNVVLNNQEAQSRYDPDRLADILEELDDLPELEATGFDRGTGARLRLEPVEKLPPIEQETDWVTVTLEMADETFDRVSRRLDELVREFDLTSHVRRS
jgi:ParB-like chromosome segregation protein Spo0J